MVAMAPALTGGVLALWSGVCGRSSWAPPVARCSVAMTSEFERTNPYIAEMRATAAAISRPGHGILATDESNPTAGKRLESIGLENTEEQRRAFRELIYTTPGLSEHISGVILYDRLPPNLPLPSHLPPTAHTRCQVASTPPSAPPDPPPRPLS